MRQNFRTVVHLSSHIRNIKIRICIGHLDRPTVALCGKTTRLPRKASWIFINSPHKQLPQQCSKDILAHHGTPSLLEIWFNLPYQNLLKKNDATHWRIRRHQKKTKTNASETLDGNKSSINIRDTGSTTYVMWLFEKKKLPIFYFFLVMDPLLSWRKTTTPRTQVSQYIVSIPLARC